MEKYAAARTRISYKGAESSSLSASHRAGDLYQVSKILLFVLASLSFFGVFFISLLIGLLLLWWRSSRGGSATVGEETKPSRFDVLFFGLRQCILEAKREKEEGEGRCAGNPPLQEAMNNQPCYVRRGERIVDHGDPCEGEYLLRKISPVEVKDGLGKNRATQEEAAEKPTARLYRFYDPSLAEKEEKGDERCAAKPFSVAISPLGIKNSGRARPINQSLSEDKGDQNKVGYAEDATSGFQISDQSDRAILQIAESSGYQPIRRIGRGSFSSVYFVKRKSDGRPFALKYIPCSSNKSLQRAMNEFELHSSVQGHPNIVKILGMFMSYEAGSSLAASPPPMERQSISRKPSSSMLFDSPSSVEQFLNSRILHSAVAKKTEPPTSCAVIHDRTPLTSEFEVKVRGGTTTTEATNIPLEPLRAPNYAPSHSYVNPPNYNTVVMPRTKVNVIPLASSKPLIDTSRVFGAVKKGADISTVTTAFIAAPELSVHSESNGKEGPREVDNALNTVINMPFSDNPKGHNKSSEEPSGPVDSWGRNAIRNPTSNKIQHQPLSYPNAVMFADHEVAFRKEVSPTTRVSYAPKIATNASLFYRKQPPPTSSEVPAGDVLGEEEREMQRPYWPKLSAGGSNLLPRGCVFNDNLAEALESRSRHEQQRQLPPKQSNLPGIADCSASLSTALAPFDEAILTKIALESPSMPQGVEGGAPGGRQGSFHSKVETATPAAASHDADALRNTLDTPTAVHYTNFTFPATALSMSTPIGLHCEPREPQSPILLKIDAKTNTLVNPYLLKGQAAGSQMACPPDSIPSLTAASAEFLRQQPQTIKPNDNIAVAVSKCEACTLNRKITDASVGSLMNANCPSPIPATFADSATSAAFGRFSTKIEEAVQAGRAEMWKERAKGTRENADPAAPEQPAGSSPSDALAVGRRAGRGKGGADGAARPRPGVAEGGSHRAPSRRLSPDAAPWRPPAGYLCLVLDPHPLGDLCQYALRVGRVEECQLVSIAYQVALVLAHLHTRSPPVIHRDLKPENVLIVAKGLMWGPGGEGGPAWASCDPPPDPIRTPTRIVSRVIPIALTDFGLATTREGGRLTAERGVGTRPYISPEAWSGETATANDMWSFGCLLYALATGCLTTRTARIMYRDSNHKGFASMIMNDIIECKYSLAFASFVLSLLTVNPLKRPTATAAIQCFQVRENEIAFDLMSPFFSNVLDL